MIIAAPDHQHVPLTIDACAAGKDVYVEKPLTHELSEAAAVIEAQNHYARIVQVGTQQRSMPQFQKAYEIVTLRPAGRDSQGASHLESQHAALGPRQVQHRSQDGRLEAISGHGPRAAVRRVSLSQLAVVLGFWRRHSDRLDGALDRHRPLVPGSRSSGDRGHDRRLVQGPGHCGKRPTPCRRCCTIRTSGVQVYFEGTFVNARNAAMLEFMGSEATLYLDRGRYEIHPGAKQEDRGQRNDFGQRAAGGRFLRPAERRGAAPGQLGGVRSQPQASRIARPKWASAPRRRRTWATRRCAAGKWRIGRRDRVRGSPNGDDLQQVVGLQDQDAAWRRA